MEKLITTDWQTILKDEFEKKYFQQLQTFLKEERQHYKIYPPKDKVFEALNLTPYKDTKVVIIGQDPYHGPNQAHGLCFSVKKGNKIPPSLRNIYQELNDDVGCYIPDHGYLKKWAEQGVLMTNMVLTVRAGDANSHKKKGWEQFTNAIIRELNQKERPIVFILWGNNAQKVEKHITADHHLIIKSYHPSPLSANRGFFGTKPFSRTNEFLKQHDLTPIDWQIENSAIE